jgi:hypothetical protein
MKSLVAGNELTFDEVTHRYRLNGKPVPGVTTLIKSTYPEGFHLGVWKIKQASSWVIEQLLRDTRDIHFISDEELDQLIKSSTTAWKKKAELAADIGKLAHAYAEEYEKRGFISDELREKIIGSANLKKLLNCIKQFRRWENKVKDEIVGSECIAASPSLHVAGMYDRLAVRNGRLVLSDFKTSGAIYAEYFIQLAGYALLIEEWESKKVDEIEVLRFGKESDEFEVKSLTDFKEYTEQFKRLVATYKFKKEYHK